ncbi:BlaI/MecI/CopY family transcriptional regulator [soil metagenome]
MPARKKWSSPRRPTDAELGILRVLWQRGPSTVREVFEHIPEDRRGGYTTVLKFLQIMTGKGLVVRDETERAHVYAAAEPAEKTKRAMVADLIDQLFDGSARALVLEAIDAQHVSAGELAEIRKKIKAREESQRPPKK